MTKRRKQKRLIRDRMARTGQAYSTARADLLLRSQASIAAPPVVMVPVAEIPRALAFYCDALGFSVTGRTETWAHLGNGSVRLGLHAGRPGGADTGLGLLVRDIAATCAAVIACGGRVDDGVPGVVTAYDPDGNGLKLMAVTPPA